MSGRVGDLSPRQKEALAKPEASTCRSRRPCSGSMWSSESKRTLTTSLAGSLQR
ncbi:SEC14 like lipid binding 2 [Homo sapiens]|uniref:SEC14 like lipid binding 2 n=1 Tax=Homo sapiens TaxID=9606 RepID=F8WED8_HUMAN|nr:SEC14 like lipid binding 2 [Homo sapiens]KAI4002459.1 SEC14 like lipid binding 2 [Homo sapiens]